MAKQLEKKIIDFRLPNFLTDSEDWKKYRTTFMGGEVFREAYLKEFSRREETTDFNLRKEITPIPNFAGGAVRHVRNALFQRLVDVVRKEGSNSYQEAISGLRGGVDNRGSSMNAFIGRKVLEDLLVIGKVGVYVDAPELQGSTLADLGGFRPYVYMYKVEDILSYACSNPEEPSEFTSLLLRDTVESFDAATGLADGEVVRYRHLWIDAVTGKVMIQFYNTDGLPITRDGEPSLEPVQLNLTRIPFVLIDIGESLLKDACEYQIALLNLVSSDMNYAMTANFPFYTEQKDKSAAGSHLKSVADVDGTASTGGQGASKKEIEVGARDGRYYGKGMDRPGFINPSSEPLLASIKLQEKFETDIRKLVNLAVQTLATRASAESKSMDNQGLDAGLAFIGLALESAERALAEHWAAYESVDPSKREIPVIKYPERYSLKDDSDRITEAGDLRDAIKDIPSSIARREVNKHRCATLLASRVRPDVLEAIFQEIDTADYTTSDPDVILKAKEQGAIGDKLAGIALGFPENEHLVAREDHALRAKRIAEAQSASSSDPGARGVGDLSANSQAGQDEKEQSRDNTLSDDTTDRTRGEGK